MNKKYFWEIRSLKKFRTVFENSEIIVGADRKNKYRTFRLFSDQIAYSRKEVLEIRLNKLNLIQCGKSLTKAKVKKLEVIYNPS